MTIQYSIARRNARLASDETVIGASPLLRLLTGAPPANCATAQSGTQLAQGTLPADFLAAPASGVQVKAGTWGGVGSVAGTVGYYRIYDSTGTTCHEQGTVTATGGGGDMTLDNVVLAVGQAWEVTSFSRTAGNA